MIAADQAQRSATAPGDSTGKLFVGMDIGGTMIGMHLKDAGKPFLLVLGDVVHV